MQTTKGGNEHLLIIVKQCVALYQSTGVPNAQNLKTGVQFSSTQSTTANDTSCAANFVAPRITFQVSRIACLKSFVTTCADS